MPVPEVAPRRSLRADARTVGMLGLLTALSPVSLALTAAALLRGLVAGPRREVAAQPRTVLVSGGKMTKALQLCRSFHQAGHRVVLVETARYRLTGHRFSRAVDRFHVVPRPEDPGYVDALLDIVAREGVDLYVPVCSPVASRYDALAKKRLSEHCEVLHGEPEMIDVLDDKAAFTRLAASLGLSVPDSHRVTSPEQVADLGLTPGGYILKSIAYDPVHRLDLTRLPFADRAATLAFARDRPITPDNPWLLSAFIEGQEFCTHSTVRAGVVQVYACCPSSASQLNYAMVDRPAIEAWVRAFVGALELTGQFSFDFIETAGGEVYAIECNPRTHSAITMFYDHPDLARAYLETGVPAVVPTAASRPTYWIAHELWRLVTRPREVVGRLRTIAEGKDAIFSWADPLPFLLVHHLQIPALLIGNLRRGTGWVKIDVNIGKLVEPGGD